MHRSDLDGIGAFDDERYPEDYDLAFRMYEGGVRVVPVRRVIHHWRDHEGRTSRNDPRYLDNDFIALKLHYFTQEVAPDMPVVIWGCGRRAKKIARALIDMNRHFRWITNNPSKVDQSIYGILVESQSILDELSSAVVIVTISARSSRVEVASVIERHHVSLTFYRFC